MTKVAVLPLSVVKNRLSAIRAELKADARSLHPDMPFRCFDKPLLWAIDSTGDRLNGSSYTEWDGTAKQIRQLLIDWPATTEISADVYLNCSESMSGLSDCCGERLSESVCIWSQEEASAMELKDRDWRENTGFFSAKDCVENSRGTYRPSCDVRIPVMKRIADRFDIEMEAISDSRRAYRYGT